jgi:hypothetical protein
MPEQPLGDFPNTSAAPPNPIPPGSACTSGELGRLSPELLAWALQQYSEAEIVAGLRELREKGGFELQEFRAELENVVAGSSR